jgi:hypothetical protein
VQGASTVDLAAPTRVPSGWQRKAAISFVTDATGFISKNRQLQITSTEQGMRIEVNPLSAEVSAIRSP